MFLNELTLIQKKCFLSLAQDIIKADKLIHSKEKLLFKNMLYEMRLPIKTKCPILKDYSILKSVFKRKKTRHYVFIELISLALIDKKYDIEEKVILNSIGKIFGINKSQQYFMQMWVKEYFRHLNKLNHFIN